MRRLHSATGLFPLGAYLLFHAWEHWPVRTGRDALFARLDQSHNTALEICCVLLPLLVHAGLGLRLSREPVAVRVAELGSPAQGPASTLGSPGALLPEPAYISPSYRRLQLGTGVVAGAYIAFHLFSAWLPRLTQLNPIGAAYGAMLDSTADLPRVVLHAIGIAAVCTHFGQGLGVALARLYPERLPQKTSRQLGIVLGVLLWLAFLNELASYATYAPLL